MAKDSPLIGEAYDLVRRIHEVTAGFPVAERDALGGQLRSTALSVASQVADGLTTDDPAERQEVLRLAAIGCVTLEIAIRLAGDLGLVRDDVREPIAELATRVADGVARERRTVRR